MALTATATVTVKGEDLEDCEIAAAYFEGVTCLDKPSALLSPNFRSFVVEMDGEERLLLSYNIDHHKGTGIFQREAELLKTIEGDHVLKVFATGFSSFNFYKIVEKVAGTLQTRIPIPATMDLSLDSALLLFRDIVKAVYFLRQHNIVHGGLTPFSIFLDQNGHVKISEFFSARGVDEDGFVDTRGPYTDPRFILDIDRSLKFTEAMDVFSLGVILFRLTQKGAYPFDRNSVVDLAFQYQIGNIEVAPFTDAWTLYLINICLMEDPEQRPTLYKLLELITMFRAVPSEHPIPYTFTMSTKQMPPHWVQGVVAKTLADAKPAFKSVIFGPEDTPSLQHEKQSYIRRVFENFKEFMPNPYRFIKDRFSALDTREGSTFRRYWWLWALLAVLALAAVILLGRFIYHEKQRRRTLSQSQHSKPSANSFMETPI